MDMDDRDKTARQDHEPGPSSHQSPDSRETGDSDRKSPSSDRQHESETESSRPTDKPGA